MVKIPEKYKSGKQFNPQISLIVTEHGIAKLLEWINKNYSNLCGHKTIKNNPLKYADPIDNTFNFLNSNIRPELLSELYKDNPESNYIMDYVTTFSSFELMYYLSIELNIEGFEYSDSFIDKIISCKP